MFPCIFNFGVEFLQPDAKNVSYLKNFCLIKWTLIVDYILKHLIVHFLLIDKKAFFVCVFKLKTLFFDT